MLIDSHCHLDRLDLTAYDGKLEQAIQAALNNGIGYMLCVCIDWDNFNDVLSIAEQYPYISASVGVHPNEKDCHEPSVEELVQRAQHDKVVAIGETGLDTHWLKEDLSWQQDRFRRHIQAAIAVNKPLIIHSREAREDTIRLLQEEHADKVAGVMHCFTETWEMAEAAMALGFYISFSGIVTFKNAKELQDVAKRMPIERMLIETDSPYLAPVPHRGKTNEPAYVKHVAEFIAELRGESYDDICAATTENFFRCFPSATKI
ncbi:MAG: TatD family deoxyribonuclease [Legionellales bacterium]|nr:TatD family deoxyribonuclease [Legionellales bacterium]|tara:strand:- start:21989 stop:22771 length:783 start_codon:yes stop_codon:yes gene_type:complete